MTISPIAIILILLIIIALGGSGYGYYNRGAYASPLGVIAALMLGGLIVWLLLGGQIYVSPPPR